MFWSFLWIFLRTVIKNIYSKFFKSEKNCIMSSSPEHDVDINVVSSPEASPQGHESSFSLNHYHSLHHESRLSPPRSPKVQLPASSLSPAPASTEQNNNSNSANNNNKSTLNNGYTSFSISSILSRSEPSKKIPQSLLVAPIPHLAQHGVGGTQDAAMLSR